MDQKPSRKLRWYEQQPVVSKSVSLLESFPPEFQVSLGETIIELAEKHCSAKDLMNNLRSLGPEKVLSIFKSKSKQRKTDQVQEVHQAMNYMLILPDKDRLYIAEQIIEVVGQLFEYFKFCKANSTSPNPVVVSELCTAYIRREFGSLQDFLAQLEARNIQESATTSVQDDTGKSASAEQTIVSEKTTAGNEKEDNGEHGTKIAHNNKDMKIKLDKFDL